jgi:hypothetical protein
MQELGLEGLEALLNEEKENVSGVNKTFFENVIDGIYPKDEDIIDGDIPYKKYAYIKGCYIKYLDPLRVIPITLDRRVTGYCYVSTQVNSHINPAQPNGVVDVSVAHYTKDKQLVNSLAEIIIKSFSKQMLDKNINLKSEIADIIMAHQFSGNKLSFVFIPENEVIRFIINEDENGKGHSIIEPSLFPARMYLLLTMYNMIYTLNNNTTRIHYLKSSGLNKDYAAQVQRAMRKFQSRRITIDDIYSYSGVLNKVGGMGEMVLPAGRGGGDRGGGPVRGRGAAGGARHAQAARHRRGGRRDAGPRPGAALLGEPPAPRRLLRAQPRRVRRARRSRPDPGP